MEPDEIEECKEFKEITSKRFGGPLKIGDFKNDPELAYMETPSFLPAGPYTYDQYVGATVKLPVGD